MKTNLLRSGMLILLTPAMLFSGVLNAQSFITVHGVVTSADSPNVLSGCSVSVKNTKRGTVTRIDGSYSLLAKKGEILLFSYVGYVSQAIKVTGDEIDVALKADNCLLQECKVMDRMAGISSCNAVPAVMSKCFPRYGRDIDAEEYKEFIENGFQKVTDHPLSTFSVDVDAASYSNMRRFLNNGQLPPADAIRTEELVNYFSYDYAMPTGNEPVKITTETGNCPWNSKHRLLRIGLKAKNIPANSLPASNLVFLIDVSGSMYGPERLDLVKSSLKLLVNNLRSKDKVAIVVYSGAAGEKLSSTPGDDKQKIREAIDRLEAGGSTAGGEGIKLAYTIARKNYIKNGNNRIILCTDGDFNVGEITDSEMEKLIEQERKSGIFLTVLGYGMGNYKDSKMQVLAEKGNGNHAYIDNLQEANRILVGEFGSTLYTVAKDVKLQLEFNPAQVQAYRLIGYESRRLNDEDFNNDLKDAGEMGAGHTVTAFYEIIPAGTKDNFVGKVDDLKYQKKQPVLSLTSSGELLTIKLRYKSPDGKASRKIEIAVIDNPGRMVSSDFRFAAAVAMFGQLLRNSDFKGDASYNKVINLAKTALDNDEKGYRREFIRLVEIAKGLQQ